MKENFCLEKRTKWNTDKYETSIEWISPPSFPSRRRFDGFYSVNQTIFAGHLSISISPESVVGDWRTDFLEDEDESFSPGETTIVELLVEGAYLLAFDAAEGDEEREIEVTSLAGLSSYSLSLSSPPPLLFLHLPSWMAAWSSYNCTQLSVAGPAIIPVASSLLCSRRTTRVITMSRTDIMDTVIYPLKYLGASTCCQTSKGSHICKMYAISFMAPIVMARSSLSLEHTSFAQLFSLISACVFPVYVLEDSATHAMHSPLSPNDAPAPMRQVHFHQVGISQMANET